MRQRSSKDSLSGTPFHSLASSGASIFCARADHPRGELPVELEEVLLTLRHLVFGEDRLYGALLDA